ncbi:hypothetical protein [Timonella senegalensis]|uniref:hypothetical protein n=1 Tax=Timonella senegalensis TaxID=1465825 RepID=UPI002FDCDB2D
MTTDVKPTLYLDGTKLLVGGVATEIVNDTNIANWLGSLSPAGATLYDTGWVTSDLTFTMGSADWTLTQYALTRVGRHISGSIRVTYNGATLTPSANGNLGDVTVLTMPTGWQHGSPLPVQATFTNSGVKTAFVRFNSATGICALTHAIPGVTLSAGEAWDIAVDYYI